MSNSYLLKNRELHIDFAKDTATDGTVKIIAQNPSITLDELAIEIGKSRRTAARQIKQLQESGIVRRVGSDKMGHWEVVGRQD